MKPVYPDYPSGYWRFTNSGLSSLFGCGIADKLNKEDPSRWATEKMIVGSVVSGVARLVHTAGLMRDDEQGLVDACERLYDEELDEVKSTGGEIYGDPIDPTGKMSPLSYALLASQTFCDNLGWGMAEREGLHARYTAALDPRFSKDYCTEKVPGAFPTMAENPLRASIPSKRLVFDGTPDWANHDKETPHWNVIDDLKLSFGKRVWTQDKVDTDWQLTFYAMLFWATYGVIPRLRIHTAWLNKRYGFENFDVVETTRTVADFRSLVFRAEHARKAIKAGITLPASATNYLCPNFCRHAPRCRAVHGTWKRLKV